MAQDGIVIPSVALREKVDMILKADKAAAEARDQSLANDRDTHPAAANYPPNPLPPAPKMPDRPIPDTPVKPAPDAPETNTGAVVTTSG